MKKIVLFGDSLFNGFRHHRDTKLISQPLQDWLGKNAHVENLSKSGATTVEGLDLLTQIPASTDLIIIEYGTNDSSYWGISCANFARNLETMINFCLPNKIILVSPWREKEACNYTIEENFKQNWQTTLKLAKKYQLPFIDLLKIRNGERNLDRLYQNDNLHLTDYANAKLINLLKRAIKKELEN